MYVQPTDIYADTEAAKGKSEPVGRIEQNLLKAIVKVVTSRDKEGVSHIGTGFLVSKEMVIDSRPSRPIFLVTNKHMVGDWNISDGDIVNYYDNIDVFFYRSAPTGVSYKLTRIELKDNLGKLKPFKLQIHPSPKVDIAIVALGEELSAIDKIDLLHLDVSYLLSFDKILSWTTGLGDQVFALGYPLGITSIKNNYPIAKSGYLASLPGEELIIDFPATNRKKEVVSARVEGKLLLVDGLIVGGNSGGPVILPYGIKTRVNPETGQFEYLKEPIKNLVIGIVSSVLGPSGLSIAFSSDYIGELIDLYIDETSVRGQK